MLYKTSRIRKEFHGVESMSIVLDKHGGIAVVIFRAELRAMFLAADYETQRIFGVELEMTDVLRTWEEQDEIYPEAAKKYGRGYQEGKIISPHECGRAGDAVPKITEAIPEPERLPLYNKVSSHVVDYLNERFPYCWNAPQRLLKKGRLEASRYNTATDHSVGKGRHIHGQLSWGRFLV